MPISFSLTFYLGYATACDFIRIHVHVDANEKGDIYRSCHSYCFNGSPETNASV